MVYVDKAEIFEGDYDDANFGSVSGHGEKLDQKKVICALKTSSSQSKIVFI